MAVIQEVYFERVRYSAGHQYFMNHTDIIMKFRGWQRIHRGTAFCALAADDFSSSFHSGSAVLSVEFNIYTNWSLKNQKRKLVTGLLHFPFWHEKREKRTVCLLKSYKHWCIEIVQDKNKDLYIAGMTVESGNFYPVFFAIIMIQGICSNECKNKSLLV